MQARMSVRGVHAAHGAARHGRAARGAPPRPPAVARRSCAVSHRCIIWRMSLQVQADGHRRELTLAKKWAEQLEARHLLICGGVLVSTFLVCAWRPPEHLCYDARGASC